MAKTARRSVASDPSSPSEYLRSASAEASSSYIPVDPLRPSGSHYTTQTIPKKFNASDTTTSRPFSSNHRFTNANSTQLPESFNRTQSDAAERQRVRMEFYATYDVMTGVRIAATLGGFFGLMVFLVVYKSRGETQETLKALKDPKIAAVAAAVMQEEEDRELQQAMEAAGMSIFPDEYDHLGYRRERLMSIGNMSAPAVFNRGYRFSSIGGGYSSLLGPPTRRFSYSESGRKSTSDSSRVLSAYPMGGSFGIDDYFLETDGDEADDEFDQITQTSTDADRPLTYLSVPHKGQESRRSSNITCCSSESSYLERRCSALTLGLTPLPPISSANPSRRQSVTDTWDYYYPGIQVIQPTPKTSPCPSEKSVNENCKSGRHKSLIEQESIDCISVYSTDDKLPDNSASATIFASSPAVSGASAFQSKLTATSNGCADNESSISCSHPEHNHHHIIRRAPLASLSSFKISSIDYQDSDLKSLGSDSVFADSYVDTDDEMEQFSTDSDEISDAQSPPNTRTIASSTAHSSHRYYPNHHHHPHNQSYHSQMFSGGSSYSSNKCGRTVSTSVATAPAVVVSTCTTENEIKSPRSSNSGGGADLENLKYSNICSNLSKSSSVHLANTFETKAIIERHRHHHRPHRHQQPSTSAAALVRDAAGTNSSSGSSSSLCSNSMQAAHASTSSTKQPMRPASYSGCTSSTLSNYNKNSNQNNKINKKSSECVDINVVVVDNRSIVSPSVILELPVISTQEIIDDPPIDPSLPGTSRKWSKETLF